MHQIPLPDPPSDSPRDLDQRSSDIDIDNCSGRSQRTEDRDSVDSEDYSNLNHNPFKRIFCKMRDRPSPPIQKQNTDNRDVLELARTTNDLSGSSRINRDDQSPSPLPPPAKQSNHRPMKVADNSAK